MTARNMMQSFLIQKSHTGNRDTFMLKMPASDQTEQRVHLDRALVDMLFSRINSLLQGPAIA